MEPRKGLAAADGQGRVVGLEQSPDIPHAGVCATRPLDPAGRLDGALPVAQFPLAPAFGAELVLLGRLLAPRACGVPGVDQPLNLGIGAAADAGQGGAAAGYWYSLELVE